MPEDYDSFDSQQRRKFWQNHIERWQISGLSQRAYCKKHDLTTHRFYDWKRRIKSADNPPVSFLPVALTDRPARTCPSIRIHTPNGFTIEVENQIGSIEIDRLLKMVTGL
jgi:hypothetical protein